MGGQQQRLKQRGHRCSVAILRADRWHYSRSVAIAAGAARGLDYSGNPPMLSAVIPVLNEAESLAALHGELSAVASEHGYDLDVVFVDDGSTDGSWAEIQRLAAAD